MDLFESVAQRPTPGLDRPRVAEVLAPAVVRNGIPLRMGKVVVAVPAPDSQEDDDPGASSSDAPD